MAFRADSLLVLWISCGAALAGCGPSAPPSAPTMGDHGFRSKPSDLSASRTTAASLGAGGPDESARPGSRRAAPPRPLALLVPEIELLESVLATTPADAEELPELAKHIANDYIELAVSASAEGADDASKAVRGNAKAALAKLAASHPRDIPHDQLLFFMAQQTELVGDLPNALATYQSLLATHPRSRYAEVAQVAIGDIYFDEARSLHDPSLLPLAKEAYQEVIRAPPPGDAETDIHGYAYYRLAWVLERQRETKGAEAAFRSAIDFATAHPGDPDAWALDAAARTDLAKLRFVSEEP